MKKPAAVTISVVIGIALALITSTAAFWSLGKLADVTKSGLFGICGPYGDDWSLWLQLGLVVLGLVGAPIIALVTGRRLHRRLAM
jgi:hypothetical protein